MNDTIDRTVKMYSRGRYFSEEITGPEKFTLEVTVALNGNRLLILTTEGGENDDPAASLTRITDKLRQERLKPESVGGEYRFVFPDMDKTCYIGANTALEATRLLELQYPDLGGVYVAEKWNGTEWINLDD